MASKSKRHRRQRDAVSDAAVRLADDPDKLEEFNRLNRVMEHAKGILDCVKEACAELEDIELAFQIRDRAMELMNKIAAEADAQLKQV